MSETTPLNRLDNTFTFNEPMNNKRYIDNLPAPNPLQPWTFQSSDIVSLCKIQALPDFNLIQGKKVPQHLSFDCCELEFFQSTLTKNMTLFQHHNEYIERCVYTKVDISEPRKHFATIIVPLSEPLKIEYDQPQIQIVNSFNTPNLIFDSCFESGNLFTAYRVYEKQYNLVLQNDFNTKGHTQWFFFKIRGMQKEQTVRFNIINLVKEQSFFQEGLKPLVYSMEENKRYGSTWRNQGYNVQYLKNNIIRGNKYNYYTLSFNYTFHYESDEVYFSHSYPYTLTNLNSFLGNVMKHPDQQKHLSCKKLCNTISGNTCPVVTITSNENKYSSIRKGVVLMARQHPGETTGSFLMEGCIEYLCGDTFEAQFLRNQFVFKCLPMMNPDGVVNGNYRCNLSGYDINRQWIKPVKKYCPTVFKAKQLITRFSEERNIRLVLDFHSHSKKQETFFYGNTDRIDSEETKVFPNIAASNSKFISLSNSRFQVRGSQNSTARVCLWRLLNYCPNIFTVETSFLGYQQDDELINYTVQDLKSIGRDLCFSIFQMEYQKPQFICNPLADKTISCLSSYTQLETQDTLKEIKQIVPTKLNDLSVLQQSDTSMSDDNPSEDQLTDRSFFVEGDTKKKKNLIKNKKSSQPLKQLYKVCKQPKKYLTSQKIFLIEIPQANSFKSNSLTCEVQKCSVNQSNKSTMTQLFGGEYQIAGKEQLQCLETVKYLKRKNKYSISIQGQRLAQQQSHPNSKFTQTTLTHHNGHNPLSFTKPESVNIFKRFKQFSSNRASPFVNISIDSKHDNESYKTLEFDKIIVKKILEFKKKTDIQRSVQQKENLYGKRMVYNYVNGVDKSFVVKQSSTKIRVENFSFNEIHSHSEIKPIRSNSTAKHMSHIQNGRSSKYSRRNSPQFEEQIQQHPYPLAKIMFQPLILLNR